jgi:rhodanese-related sulfurtransferase
VANGVSPRGLSLTRDYFHATTSSNAPHPVTTETNGFEGVASRLREEGLKVADIRVTKQFFEDPRYKQGFILFIDARDEDKYRAGHIPGAWQFDYYHPERQLATVFPLVQLAHEVLIYCQGGECEDSRLVALFFRENGVPADKLHVYAGGFKEWSGNALPVETGERAGVGINPIKGP